MPILVLTAATLLINAVDRSALTSKVEVSADVDEKDVTTYTSAGWKSVLGGLKSGNVAVTLKNDLAAAGLDEIMWGLFGTVVPFEVRAVNSARSTSNPSYTGNMLIKSWTPITGSPGDVNEASYTFPTSGPVTRLTA
jgi:hypothetical protein